MMSEKTYAVLSIDVEDWYHLDYIKGLGGSSYSMLDGLDNFISICQEHGVPATYFFLSDLADSLSNRSSDIGAHGGEVAMHGTDHTRPMMIPAKSFEESLKRGKEIIQECFKRPIYGYRAPCFSLDRARLDIIKDAGFRYDSSKIEFREHPLYGSLDIKGFNRITSNVYSRNGFYEFEIPTFEMFGRKLPISGGGYIRIIPWYIIKRLIRRYLAKENTFFVFLHPFEMSLKPIPKVDNLSVLAQFRFGYNTFVTPVRLKKLIQLLKSENFEFKTFFDLTRQFEQQG
jgi:peptidoglycan/xylan/chitin deacetylase (PgdA/CDA1 family)